MIDRGRDTKVRRCRQRMVGLFADAKAKGLTEEQKHLDKGTIERDYWHYGYAVALADVFRNFNLSEK